MTRSWNKAYIMGLYKVLNWICLSYFRYFRFQVLLGNHIGAWALEASTCCILCKCVPEVVGLRSNSWLLWWNDCLVHEGRALATVYPRSNSIEMLESKSTDELLGSHSKTKSWAGGSRSWQLCSACCLMVFPPAHYFPKQEKKDTKSIH